MTYNMNDKEFSAVLELPASQRYEHFVKRVADMETIWSLSTADGWVLMGDSEEREIIPVWPHERYAAVCASGQWANSQPRSIPMGEWLASWLSGIERDGRLIAVFPIPSGKGMVMTAERLKADLEEELRNYE
jgi:hypothetical protein